MARKKHKNGSVISTVRQMISALFEAFLAMSIVRHVSLLMTTPPLMINDETKKNRKRKKKKQLKSSVESINLTEPQITLDHDILDHDEMSFDIAEMDDGMTDSVTEDRAPEHIVFSDEIQEDCPTVVTSFSDEEESKYLIDVPESISSLSMNSVFSTPSLLEMNTTASHSERREDDLLSDDTTIASSLTFVECTSRLPKPLSYSRYPFLEVATLKLASILHEQGYDSYAFGGVVYRRYSEPGDIDLVIPDFMSLSQLKTLTTCSPDAMTFIKMKALLSRLRESGAEGIGFNHILKIPGYQRENRYMLPLIFSFEEGKAVNVDLTLFSGTIDQHAERDLTMSMLYYDPLHKKMYHHSSFYAIEDLFSGVMRPIFEPVSLMRASPRLLFNFIKLHVTERMIFDPSLVVAFLVLGQQEPNIFLGFSDVTLKNELLSLDTLLDKQSQLLLFWKLGLFLALYVRIQPSRLEKLVSYQHDMIWFQASVQYQHQCYTIALQHHEMPLASHSPAKSHHSRRRCHTMFHQKNSTRDRDGSSQVEHSSDSSPSIF